jgi:hypothetical protein
VICSSFCKGRRHDFGLYKQSKVHIREEIKVLVDSGYQGIGKIHSKAEVPKKRRKKQALTKQQKKHNQLLAKERVLNENVIGSLKRFKIIADRYRNRRKRLGLRFNLIAGIYNWELNI